MTDTPADLHVYLRNINPDERTSLTVLAGLITRPHAAVLDLGCGSGALGQYLTQTRPCVVDGLTWSAAEAQHAQAHYRRVEVADLERVNLTELFAGCTYDYIVCADVLEHLRQPERVLAACRSLLTPGGKLLISVPNAGYAGLVAELLQGEFKYRDEGLLDRTHLRFFTRRSLQRFMGENSWALDGLELVERPLPESEFRTPFDSLPPAVSRFLLHAPDALTYQFIGSASPCASPVLIDEVSTPNAHAHALFTAQLYLAQDGAYNEAHKISCAGHIGQTRQTLRFAITDPYKNITQLRLDPADRPGFFHLYNIRLVHPKKGELWNWGNNSTTQLKDTPHAQIVWQTLLPSVTDATMLLLTGEDPWFELPIPSALLQTGIDGCTLEVEAGWPMSADYWALSSQVRPLQDKIIGLTELQNQTQETLEAALSQANQTLQQTKLELQKTHETLQKKLQQALESDKALKAAKLERIKLQMHLEKSQQEFSRLEQHLRAITNSKSFRATRPIVKAKMRLDRLLGRNQPRVVTQAPQTYLPISPPAYPVDVIVPVYRGLNDTQICIESVLASSCSSAMRLIAINDASPEPEVTQWLRDKAAQDPRLTLLENEKNLGFVGTVNRGMALSQTNDILLLNSDTEVANDWLDRIRRTAYSDTKIASVTPFSNNATICSYPIFCAANPLPTNETTASLDQLFAKANANQSIDVPTGVGFCMYIRRDCLNEVGFFDEEHFGKGYGEENDFCQRAHDRGWRNLHALDTFVLHTGGVSFGESKNPREQAAMETLRTLHPGYESQVMAFLQRDPACNARLAVDWLRVTSNGTKPVVLAVLHDRGGGTERHVLELAQTLANSVTFISLKPSGTHHVVLQLAQTNSDVHSIHSSKWVLSDTWRAVFDLTHDRPKLIEFLRTLGVAHIHVHHLLGHHQFVWDLPNILGVSYDFTCHDFYSFCTNITLTGKINYYQIDAKGECCDGSHPPSLPAVIEKIDDWRSRNRLFLENARFVFAPSLETAQRILTVFPSAPVRFAPHTDINLNHLNPPRLQQLHSQQPLRIVVIGALSIIKGAEVLEATARLAKKSGAPLEFHLIGFGYRHLQTSGTALRVHGEYDEVNLPALLQRIAPDVAWFPALWPETYSYTLSAALQAALPVVVPDIGAFVERVANRPWSWIQKWSSTPEEWLELFIRIREQIYHHQTPGATPSLVAAPPLTRALQDLEKTIGGWQYEQDYKTFMPAVSTPAESALKAQEIVNHFVSARLSNPTVIPTRKCVYRLILTLQRLPILGLVMRIAPKSWRYNIKQLLNG